MAASASISQKLHDELVAFANQGNQRLLVIETEDDLRLDVLEQVDAIDILTPKPVIVSIFESPWLAGDPCWDARHEELEDEWDEIRKAISRLKHRPPPPLPEVSAFDLVTFAERLKFAAENLAKNFDGVAVVFAPLDLEDQSHCAKDLAALINAKALEKVRWLLVTVGASGAAPLVAALGPDAVLFKLINDPASDAAAMKSMVAAMRAAPVGAPTAQLMGGAGPRVAPPPRVKATSQPAAAGGSQALAALELSPGLGDIAGMTDVRVAVMDAALAAAEKDFPKALVMQRQARDITHRLGMMKETALLDLILGGYGLMAGQPKLGLQVFVDVEERAVAAGWGALAVQAAMAKAGALSLLERRPEAAVAYVQGGRNGTKLGSPVLAIEAFALGGQAALDVGDHRSALSAWAEAALTAEQIPAAEASSTSVLSVTEKGADLCTKLGLATDAQKWRARGQALQQSFEAAQLAEGQAAS